MALTYGQLKERGGNKISYSEYEKEVADRLKKYILFKPTRRAAKLCRRLYREGYTIADAVGMIILNT